MTETLERALEPLLIIGSFCNLDMFEYPRGGYNAGHISLTCMLWLYGAFLRIIISMKYIT